MNSEMNDNKMPVELQYAIKQGAKDMKVKTRDGAIQFLITNSRMHMARVNKNREIMKMMTEEILKIINGEDLLIEMTKTDLFKSLDINI